MIAQPLCLLAAVLLTAQGAIAKVVEETIQVPVHVADAYGKTTAQDIVVTLFHDDQAARPMPVLLINHGRAAEAEERAAMGRARFPAVSRWFASHGFLVVVPTRVGYGESGGADVEDSGRCDRKNYPPAFAAAAQETLAVLDAVRQRPDVAGDRSVIVGQSVGGLTSVAVAAMNPPGVQAIVNFAGGGGGDPKNHAQQPCGQSQLARLFKSYGETARVPMLWIYTENDMFFGPSLPPKWFDAFRAEGGVAEFTQFPPDGDDGHHLFTHNPAAWQPRLLDFLHAHGYPDL